MRFPLPTGSMADIPQTFQGPRSTCFEFRLRAASQAGDSELFSRAAVAGSVSLSPSVPPTSTPFFPRTSASVSAFSECSMAELVRTPHRGSTAHGRQRVAAERAQPLPYRALVHGT